jgi:hypothetical protein
MPSLATNKRSLLVSIWPDDREPACLGAALILPRTAWADLGREATITPKEKRHFRGVARRSSIVGQQRLPARQKLIRIVILTMSRPVSSRDSSVGEEFGQVFRPATKSSDFPALPFLPAAVETPNVATAKPSEILYRIVVVSATGKPGFIPPRPENPYFRNLRSFLTPFHAPALPISK